jgi:Zn-dependent M28 family amino/carboxypeptidase
MGSLHYARAARASGDDIRAMLSLETMGWYSHERGSQHYPGLVRALYPDTGDFLGFVAALSSRGLLREAVRSFRAEGVLPSEGAALPAFVPGVGWSDHWAFAEVGYPAIMVTDTAVFRYPHYHTAQDTPDKVDTLALARAHAGVRSVVTALANAPR